MPKKDSVPRLYSLAALRRGRGMSQRELGRAIGVTCGAVAQWEMGYCLPNTDNLLALADLFGCSVDAVLGRDPPREAG